VAFCLFICLFFGTTVFGDSHEQEGMDNLEEVCENEPNAYDYVQACYVANDIPLELLEDIWPTVEFLVNAVVAYTQPADASNDDQFECKLIIAV
jgi:hypothetical protein